MNIQNLIRPNILKLKPYASARDEFKDFEKSMTFLDANENPFETGLNRYPDPQQSALKLRLSTIKNCNPNQLLLGNGSDEVLDLIFRTFCEPGKDNVILLPPTYGMYEVLANLNNIETIKIQLNTDFQPNVSDILKAANSNSKILFLCSPNNPTANSFEAESMEALLQKFKGIVVIDEAYTDFSDSESWSSRLAEFPNLIVIHTLSKAYGLAGIRLGMGMASPEIVSVLSSIKPPYNINQLTQQTALNKLENLELVTNQIQLIKNERIRVLSALQNIDFVKKRYPSDANFILVQVDDANKRYKQLIEKEIVVRNRTKEPLCENCLRFTIGTPDENTKLLTVLKSLI
ncbi:MULTISPECIES: histidinol-phosphate transaminase [Bizionia]|uniref:Histidinol-phosphate aminotransferase n=1 Tax=Bizionia algoritergicola TaxID=291187 RepID=A0A5D0QYU1_9FLAO|nr:MULTISPECIES: histidinol-phosphate transaminase [Bizionia]OBX24119.1 histidinol-phosphate transaminase [Bizionia sp. APA-3]TYB73628.1 histidinol-phosphate transaminase [Bizionia algoritergicola]